MKNLPLKLLGFIAAFLLCGCFCFGQIVNVESLRKQTDTTGIAGGLALNGSYLDNDKIIYTLSFVPNVQYKWDQDLLLLIGDYKITKSENVNFEDAAFLHFRYSHEYTDVLRWESFMQIQDNKITKLKYRLLIGSGLRLKLLGEDWFRLYLGVIPMFERELIDNEARTVNKTFRLSQYLSFTFLLSDHANIYSTTYYQPVLGDIADYRFYNEQKVKVNLVKNLNLTLSSLYIWDNQAPAGAPGRTLQLKTGLQIDF